MTKAFQVILTIEAKKDLKDLDQTVWTRLMDKLNWMGENAEYLHHQPLSHEWGGAFKYRVGDYRIIYQLDRSSRNLTILKVGHRRDIYR